MDLEVSTEQQHILFMLRGADDRRKGLGCDYCKNQLRSTGYHQTQCDAPQLSQHLEQGEWTHAQTCRDVKSLCGKLANWFLPRGDAEPRNL